MLEIRDKFPENSGLYLNYSCRGLRIFAMIPGASKILPVIDYYDFIENMA